MDTNSSLLYYIQTCETDSVTDTGPLITFIRKGENCLAVLLDNFEGILSSHSYRRVKSLDVEFHN